MEPRRYRSVSYFRFMLKPFLGVLDLRARSTRTEVFAFWLACMSLAIAGMAIGWTWSWVGFGQRFNLARAILAEALPLVIWLPLLALLIRRIHDIGLRAWPAVPIYVFAIVAGQWSQWNWAASGSMVDLPLAAEIPRLAGVVLLYVALLWPGSPGPNRFGPDPRDAAPDSARI